MGPIKGRADDMLIIRGVNLYPTQIEEVLKDLPEFSAHYQLVITKKGDLDALEVRVELDPKIYDDLRLQHLEDSSDDQTEYLIKLKKKLAEKIKNTIGLSMKITLEDFNRVPRSEGGKLNRTLDLRKS